MRDPNQKMRYSNAELSLIKNTFAGNEIAIYAVRKHMLGCDLDKGEQTIVDNMSVEVKNLLQKVFMPTIDGDSPLFQIVDMPTGLNIDLKGKSIEEGMLAIESKIIEMSYIEQRLEALYGNVPLNAETITLGGLSNLRDVNVYVNIIARNYLLSYIDSFCNELKNLAGAKEDSVEKTLEKLKLNSAK